jgi:hypothetical protein
MISKYYVIEHHGQFISRFCYDVTLLVEDLSSARLLPNQTQTITKGNTVQKRRNHIAVFPCCTAWWLSECVGVC